MDKPNVLLLVVDSLRADAVYGGRIALPNISQFARRGAMFEQCISTTTTTTPSFSSMLTGCYPPLHGVRGLQGYRLSSSVTTMPEVFAAAGYETHAEVTGPLLPETGVLRGFEDARHRPGYKMKFFGWRDEVVTRMQAYTRPWLMLLHIWEVHRPFRSPPDFTKRHDKAGYEAAVAATDEYLKPVFDAAGDETIVVITGDHGEEYARGFLDRAVLRASRKFRNLTQPRRWWPALDHKLQSKTVGHGFALHEHLVRVPLIICGPGISSITIPDQTRHVDLLPTLADLCGLDPPSGISGRSLTPLIDGGGLPEEPAYIEAVGVKLEGDRITGARTPDWKLLKRGSTKPVLYKLNGSAGPNERKDVSGSNPDVVAVLEEYIAHVDSVAVEPESGMSADDEALVEQHLRDLGYI